VNVRAAPWLLVAMFTAGCPDGTSAGAPDAGVGPDAGPTGCTTDDGCASDPAGPRCDIASGRCVACLLDAHCRAGCERCRARTCERVPGACCDDADCPATHRCDARAHVCRGCEDDAACRSCERCDRPSGLCVRRDDACCEDSDCVAGCQRCRDDACVLAEGRCCASADCTATTRPRCDPAGAICAACRDDADCPACRTCDAATGACVATPDRCCVDGDCVDPGAPFCDAGAARCRACLDGVHCGAGACLDARCVSCGTNADCRLGGRCDASAGRCVEPDACADDADCGAASPCVGGRCGECADDGGCPGGQTCAGGTCREPAVCASPIDCRAGRVCRDEACTSVPCTDDRLEENDRPVAAWPVVPGHLPALAACPNDDDYFALPAEDGSTLRVTLTFDTEIADLVPVIYFSDGGTLLGDPTPTGRVLELDALAADRTVAGQVLLGVVGFGTSAPYALDLEVLPPDACRDDAREEDDSVERATPLATGAGGVVVVDGLLCVADADWFTAGVPPGRMLEVTLRPFVPGPARLTLWDAAAERVLADAVPVGGLLAASVSTGAQEASRTVAVEVVGTRGAYQLEAEVGPPRPPNDRCAGALPLDLTTGAAAVDGDLSIATDRTRGTCGGGGSPDLVYRLALATPTRVALQLSTFGQFDGLLYVRAATCDGAEVACADDPEPPRIERDLPAGHHFVFVDAIGGVGGPFTLTALTP
jgi:hypothetical protein